MLKNVTAYRDFGNSLDDKELSEGFKHVYNYLKNLNEDNLKDAIVELAVDYANLFFGVLYAKEKKGIPHPSESVYLTGLLYQEPTDEVRKIYYKHRLIKSGSLKGEPEDHIALELYFMARLCERSLRKLNEKRFEEVAKLLKTQFEFLKNHLLKWAPQMTGDVIRYAETDFYKGIGRITKGVLEADYEELNNFLMSLNNLR